MKQDRELEGLLEQMRRAHRAIAAPESVETALCAEVKRRQQATAERKLRLTWAWGVGLALVAVVAGGGAAWELRRVHGPEEHMAKFAKSGLAGATAAKTVQANAGQISPGTARVDAPDPTHSLPSAAGEGARAVSTSLRDMRAGRARHPAASLNETAGNTLEQFVPLPVSEGLPPGGELSVVRVKLLGSDLQQYGLEAPADTAFRELLAEFVVGEDGLPRAIRIVQ